MTRSTLFTFFATLAMSASALAQFEACPGGVQVGQQCGGGVCQPICQYPDTPSQGAQTPPAPPREIVKRGVWADRWGAIADDKDGKLGIATGFSTEQQAERAAVDDCVSRGGSLDGCQHIAIRYRNSCVAYVWGSGHASLATDATLELAEARAHERCKAETGAECELFYSDCSEAVFLGYE